MLEKIRIWMDKYRLLEQGDHVVVACSGGPDSLALLHILLAFRLEYNMKIVVAHVDHMFRGQESAKEAEFVAEFCARYGIDCYPRAIDVPRLIRETGMSAEEAARKARYQYLREVARDTGSTKIATGHHQDDQAETVLMNLFRGAGSAGIRGMQPVNGDIIRPLLSVSREEILAYCQKQGLEPMFDSSNLSANYLRNRIRLQLLPQLESQYNGAVKESLCRTAAIIGDEHAFIRQTAQLVWDQVVREDQQGLELVAGQMQLLHVAVKREIIRMTIEKKQGSLTGISFYHVETLIEMLSHGRVGSKIQLPGGLTIYKTYDGLYVGEKTIKIPELTEDLTQELMVPGITKVDILKTVISAELTTVEKKRERNVAIFDADKVEFPLFVRTRRPGDRFVPFGFTGNKKLKEFFIDNKIVREQRDVIPIVCDGEGHIIWIGGYRQSQQARTTDETERFLVLTILENAIKSY